MKQITVELCTLAERKPENGQACWVLPTGRYPMNLVYNEYHNCWDDSEGDDMFYKLNETDIWMPLPNYKQMTE